MTYYSFFWNKFSLDFVSTLLLIGDDTIWWRIQLFLSSVWTLIYNLVIVCSSWRDRIAGTFYFLFVLRAANFWHFTSSCFEICSYLFSTLLLYPRCWYWTELFRWHCTKSGYAMLRGGGRGRAGTRPPPPMVCPPYGFSVRSNVLYYRIWANNG